MDSQPVPLPDLSPRAAGTVRAELRARPSPEECRSLAASYRRDVERARSVPELAYLVPEYEAIAAHIEAAAEAAR